MVREFRARRDLVLEELAGIEDFETFRPAGAFYAFPRFDVPMNSEALARRILEKGKVAVTPGSAFGAAGEGHLRLSFAASRETIVEGVQRIRDLLATI
jgi:aspartate aminotransferase